MEEEEEEEVRQHPEPEILHSKAHKSCLTFTNSGLVLVLLTGRQIPDLLNFLHTSPNGQRPALALRAITRFQ